MGFGLIARKLEHTEDENSELRHKMECKDPSCRLCDDTDYGEGWR